MAHIKSIELGGTTEYLIEPALYITTSLKVNSTTAYTATLNNFALDTGVTVWAKFGSANAANATLDVNNTGDKAIYYESVAITANQFKSDHIYNLVYDGTQWNVVGDIDTQKNYGNITTAGKIGSGNNLVVTESGTVKAGATIANAINSQDQTTKFLRQDGTWAVPSYTTNTDHYDWTEITNKPDAFTADSHTHGNISNDGQIGQTTNWALANGDGLVVFDTSNSNKLERSAITFDATTEGLVLSKKGTWVDVLTVKQTVKTDNVNYPILISSNSSPTTGTGQEAAYDTGITINPNTHTITATNFTGTASRATADADGNNIASTYAPLASPALSGVPTAPTAANGNNSTQIATTAFVINAFTANDAMIYKGIVEANSDLPETHYQGWTYKVAVAGTYAGVVCEIGDMIICNTDGTSANNDHWNVIQTNIDGAVVGPASSTANAIARFNGDSGKIIKNSLITINDDGYITIPHTANKTTGINFTYSTAIDFFIGTGTDNASHGLYDNKASKWILYAGSNNKWELYGNAATATKWESAQKVYVTLGTDSTISTIQGGSSNAETIGVHGILNIANGGTGTDSITAFGIPYGSSTSDGYIFTDAGSSGYILIGGGSDAAPSWQEVLPIAHGGLGATSFTDNCIIVPKTTSGVQAFESRGLKVSGEVNNNVTIEPNASNKTLTIQTTFSNTAAATSNLIISSAFNLYLNKPSAGSTIFTSGGASDSNEAMRINTSGKVLIGKPDNPNTLTTDDLYVVGSVTFANKLKFTNTSAIAHIDASGDLYINRASSKAIIFQQNGSNQIQIDTNNYFCPTTNNTLQIGATNARWKTAYFTTSLFIGSTSYTASNSNDNGAYLAPGILALSKTTAGDGLYLYGVEQEYAHLEIKTLGTTSVQGEACLTLGNNITNNTNKNSRGRIRLYNTDQYYADITATGWTSGPDNNSVGALESFTIIGKTSNSANVSAYSTLILGNNATVANGSNAHSQGNLRIYSELTTYTDIRSQGATNDQIFYLPKYNGTMYAVHAGSNSAVGSETQPVYIAENGRVTACTTTVGDEYTPVYINEGVMTAVNVVQKINWSMSNGNKSVKISVTGDNIFTTNSIVIAIVVTSGGDQIKAPLTWKSGTKWIAINTSTAVTGTVSGYILVVRGVEMADSNFTYTRTANEVS